MDSLVRAFLLILGVMFVLIFGGLTLVALSSAISNFASFLTFGFSFLILALVLIGLIGAIRNPPDD